MELADYVIYYIIAEDVDVLDTSFASISPCRALTCIVDMLVVKT